MKSPNRQFKDAIYEQFSRIGKAVSNPHRLELLDLICQGEKTVETLSRETGLTVANTSQHLQTLRVFPGCAWVVDRTGAADDHHAVVIAVQDRVQACAGVDDRLFSLWRDRQHPDQVLGRDHLFVVDDAQVISVGPLYVLHNADLLKRGRL